MGYRQLTQSERYVMANMFGQRYSQRAIARALDRSPSTISRERRRNASIHDGSYRVERAQEQSMARRWRSRKKSQFSQEADMRHCVLTLVERVSGYLVMRKLQARTKEQASTALARMAIGLRGKLKTITLDNGTEFHDHEIVEKRFGVKPPRGTAGLRQHRDR